MIYLIGGAPRCGKTIFAKQLAAKKRISWIATDLLRVVVKSCFPVEELAEAFPEEDYRTASSARLLKAELQEAKSLWPGVRDFIQVLVKYHHDYVIEGVHLLPQFVAELKKSKVWEEVRVVYLIKIDCGKIREGLDRSRMRPDWILESARTEADLTRAAKLISIKSRYIERQAKKHDFTVVNTEDEFRETIQRLLDES